MLWLGVVLFSIGPVMVAAATGPGDVLALWRQWFGVIVLGLVWFVSHTRKPVRLRRRGLMWAAASGLFFSLHQLAFMVAIQRTSVVDVALMQVLLPLMVGVLAAIFLHERPTLAFAAWSGLAILGALVVAVGRGATGGGDFGGMVLAIANVAAFAGFFLCSRLARGFIDTVPILVFSCLSAAILSTVLLLILQRPVGEISKHDLLIALGVAILPGALGHYVSTYPLPYVSLTLPSVLQLAVPVMAGLLAWVTLGQAIGVAQVIGGAVLLVGVFGVIRSDRAAAAAQPVDSP